MTDLKPGWQRVKFGEVVRLNKETCKDPETAGINRVIGLEHLEPGDLRVRSWADVADGTTFSNRVRPGQVLFGKRRAYQRKVAVADFDAICSGDIYVFETAGKTQLLQELLPYICQTDSFFGYAVGTSAGSLSPRTNWKSLAKYEFALPPLQEQQQMATALITLQNTSEALKFAYNKAKVLLDAFAMHSLRQNCLQKLKSSSSENGAAPNGWRVVSISELCSRITYGFTNPMPTTEAGPWMVTAKDIGNGRINYFTARHTSDEAFEKELTDKSRPLPGDVLLSKDGTLGRVGVVGDASICVNQSVAVLRPRSSVPGEFLAWTLRSNGMQQRLLQDIGGTAVKHLYITKVGDTRLIVPEAKSEMESIAHSLSEAEEIIFNLDNRIARLKDVGRSIMNSFDLK